MCPIHSFCCLEQSVVVVLFVVWSVRVALCSFRAAVVSIICGKLCVCTHVLSTQSSCFHGLGHGLCVHIVFCCSRTQLFLVRSVCTQYILLTQNSFFFLSLMFFDMVCVYILCFAVSEQLFVGWSVYIQYILLTQNICFFHGLGHGLCEHIVFCCSRIVFIVCGVVRVYTLC